MTPSWGLGMVFRSSVLAALVSGALALAHAGGGVVTQVNAVNNPLNEDPVSEVMAMEVSPKSVPGAKPMTIENPAVTEKPVVIETPVKKVP